MFHRYSQELLYSVLWISDQFMRENLYIHYNLYLWSNDHSGAI